MKILLTLTCLAIGLAAGFGIGRATAPAPDFSQYSASPALAANASPKALWQKFTADLDVAGRQILDTFPRDAHIDQAEALRYMLQQVTAATEAALLRQPGEPPLLRLGATTLNKWGLDSADAKYQGAAIDGNGRYLLSGTLGSARLFAVQLATIIEPYRGFGEITGDRLVTDAQGNFELLIAAQRPADWTGNWLELNPEATDLLVREYYRDWASEQPGSFTLTRLDTQEITQPLDLVTMARLMDDAIAQFYLRVPQWQERSDQILFYLTNKVRMDQPGDGLAANYYGPGAFTVGRDEALVIEIDPPPAAMWSVQLGNYWWESIDYLTRTASFNDAQAVADPDGIYRFVLSHQDPGVPNWLDPAGHESGMILFRQLQAQAMMEPEMTLVELAELDSHLPADRARIAPGDRETARAARLAHAARRWAP